MIGKIRNMLTFEGLAYACYDYPDMVEDMVETSCVLVEDFLDQVLPHFDFDYATRLGGHLLQERPDRLARLLHAASSCRATSASATSCTRHGIDLWYTDCDGDVRPLLPGFLEAGINCLFPYEVNSCVHPAELLDEYGKDLRIMGGVDKMELGKGPAAIKAYLETLVPLVERGGYIPFCDHRCPPNVKPETTSTTST